MKREAFVIGIDFGTDSVRSVLADTADGDVVSVSVQHYPRWADGRHRRRPRRGADSVRLVGERLCPWRSGRTPRQSPAKETAATDKKTKRIVTEDGVFPQEVAAKELQNRKY